MRYRVVHAREAVDHCLGARAGGPSGAHYVVGDVGQQPRTHHAADGIGALAGLAQPPGQRGEVLCPAVGRLLGDATLIDNRLRIDQRLVDTEHRRHRTHQVLEI